MVVMDHGFSMVILICIMTSLEFGIFVYLYFGILVVCIFWPFWIGLRPFGIAFGTYRPFCTVVIYDTNETFL